jgi:hypothetical protein
LSIKVELEGTCWDKRGCPTPLLGACKQERGATTSCRRYVRALCAQRRSGATTTATVAAPRRRQRRQGEGSGVRRRVLPGKVVTRGQAGGKGVLNTFRNTFLRAGAKHTASGKEYLINSSSKVSLLFQPSLETPPWRTLHAGPAKRCAPPRMIFRTSTWLRTRFRKRGAGRQR